MIPSVAPVYKTGTDKLKIKSVIAVKCSDKNNTIFGPIPAKRRKLISITGKI